MPNTVSDQQIKQLSEESLIELDKTVNLGDLEDIYVYDTYDRGLIVENIEYLNYEDFISRLRG